jgi:hypothetical protein
LTWPLKVLAAIVPQERIGEEMLSLLDQFDTEYTRNVEPKVQLLQLLEGHPSDDVRIAAEPFLQDAGETVRFTAANTVFAMGDPESVPTLIAALEQEESLRVKNRIAQGLADRGWPVPASLADACRAGLPPRYTLAGDKVVSA